MRATWFGVQRHLVHRYLVYTFECINCLTVSSQRGQSNIASLLSPPLGQLGASANYQLKSPASRKQSNSRDHQASTTKLAFSPKSVQKRLTGQTEHPNGTCNISATHTLPTANRSWVVILTVFRFWLYTTFVTLSTLIMAFPAPLTYARRSFRFCDALTKLCEGQVQVP